MGKLFAFVIGVACLAAPIMAWSAYPPFDALTWTVTIVLSLVMVAASVIAFGVMVVV